MSYKILGAVRKMVKITIRFQPEHLKVLREKAFGLGIGPITLARMWILEHIKETTIGY